MPKKYLTVEDLYKVLEDLIKADGSNADKTVFIAENFIKWDAVTTRLRQVTANDFKIEKDLDYSPAELESQLTEGLVIGYLPTIN
jgi:hypothetical protein